MKLLSDALDVMRDQLAPTGLREACCAFLTAALDEGLEVPASTAISVWSFITELAPRRSVEAQFRLGEVVNDDLFRAALGAVCDPASGIEVREMCFEVLCGEAHAPHMDEATIVDLVDRQHLSPGDVARLIERVHALRGLERDKLLAIRDRWAASNLASTRVAAVEIGALIARPEEDFWSRMIEDQAEDVRSAVADVLAKTARTEFATKLIQARLEHEQSIEVRADLHRGMHRLLRRRLRTP